MILGDTMILILILKLIFIILVIYNLIFTAINRFGTKHKVSDFNNTEKILQRVNKASIVVGVIIFIVNIVSILNFGDNIIDFIQSILNLSDAGEELSSLTYIIAIAYGLYLNFVSALYLIMINISVRYNIRYNKWTNINKIAYWITSVIFIIISIT